MSVDVYLPSELWLTIFSYLDYKDLVSCSQVNRSFNEMCKTSSLWRPLCNKYWLTDRCPADSTLKEQFGSQFNDFGRYIDCYGRLKQAFDDLLNFIGVNCQQLLPSIQSGVREEDLNYLESKLDCKLPNELRCLYRIHNSQRDPLSICSLIFGHVFVYDFHRGMSFVRCEDLMCFTNLKGILPIVWSQSTSYIEFVLLKEVEGLNPNYVYSMSTISLRNGTDGLKGKEVFIIGKSLTDWFTDYVDSLVKGLYSYNKSCILRFYHEPGCEVKSHSIEVSAATVFLPELSRISEKRFVHSYRITLKMDKEAVKNESCQLLTRHWVVTDEEGDEECVDGDGVIGEFPILRPGVSYSWASLTSFKTKSGNMRGHFGMVNLSTGIKFNIECPIFHMRCPPYVIL
ncbi:F-box only protein 3 [Chamberlinius hualienensis]